jgi:hypothetical protein
VTRGLSSPGGPRPARSFPRPRRSSYRPGNGASERSARLPAAHTLARQATRAALHPGPRAHTHRTVLATLGLEEPGATRQRRAQLPVPSGPCGEGAVAKRLLAPLGDKNPNLRSHHAHSRAHTHTLTRTPSPLPRCPKVSRRKRPEVHALFFPLPRHSEVQLLLHSA